MDTQEPSTSEVDSHLQEDTLLRFRVGPFRFCVPAIEVEGIIVPPALTRIPLNPPHSKGVFMHHQRLASALSLRSKFGLPDNDDNNLGQLILGEVSVGLIAFWVDEVYETVNSAELEWRAMPDFVPHAAFDRFAAKGTDIVMASTMQQLYDVPAEEAASMLAGVRKSFDLPDDIAPVASASGESTESGELEQDTFGDLTEIEPAQSEDSVTQSIADTDSSSSVVIKSGVEAQGNAHPTGSAARDAVSGSVVDLSARRTVGHSVSTGQTSEGPAGKSTPAPASTAPGATNSAHRYAARQQQYTGQHAAARASAGHASAANVRAETVHRSRGFDARSKVDSRSAQSAFTGGTHTGAYDRLHQNQTSAGSSQYRQPSQYSQSPETDRDEEKSSTAIWWWVLAALLLILLLAFWLWPDSKKSAISTIPNQNYQTDNSFSSSRKEAAPEPITPTVQEPVTSYESVSPPATPSETAVTEAFVQNEVPAPAAVAEVEPEPIVETPNSNEVYRLEGKEVTVTVERKQASPAEEVVEPVAAVKVKSLPGYDEFVHIVVKGDTLWDIAAKYLKNPFRYPELAELSRINNPDLIYPGDTVRIRAKKN